MLGIRNNCELIYSYLGGFCGLLTGFILLQGSVAPAGSADSVKLSLLTALFGLIMVCVFFSVFYRQRFLPLLFSLIIPAIVLGFVLYHVMLLFTVTYGQPFILFTIGVLFGIALGRVLCAPCYDREKQTRGA